MKKMKKIMALVISFIMILAMSTTAMAAGTGSIIVPNASKGEKYKIVKLFDASVTGKNNGSIVYTGTIPETLKSYFEYYGLNNNKYIKAKQETLSAEAVGAMKTWASAQTPVQEKTGNGGELTFTGLDYGYYVMVSSQGAAITVSSTNPTATIYDKNYNEPHITKTVNDTNVYIGQTVTYTLEFPTTNWLGTDSNAKQVVEYVIEDTLPEFLSDVTVTGITLKKDGTETALTTQQFANKKITIPWVDKDNNSLYDNGSTITITYTAKVTAEAKVDGDGNKNIVTLSANVDEGGEKKPWDKSWKDDETIYTYAAALLKVDENKESLAGAKFAAKGLTVTGSNGNYTVTGYDDDENAALGTVMDTDAEGKLIIKGIPSDITLSVTETEAPKGYALLDKPVSVNAKKISEEVTTTSTTVYYDENGEVTSEETNTSKTTITFNEKLKAAAVKIVNVKGVALPSTGGIGTTIFYLIGGILVVFAGVLLFTKKRMNKEF